MTREVLTDEGKRYVVRDHMSAVILTAIALLSAWHIGWLSAWLYGAVGLALKLGAAVVLARVNPSVLNARGTRQKMSQREKIFFLFFVPAGFAVPIVAGLDVGAAGWTHRSAAELVFGLSAIVAGMSFVVWALAVNKFFEPTVRLQSDRGHYVCTDGPYRIVRHPGYAGAIVAGIGVPFVLGSMWCFVPFAVTVAAFIVRTRYEDRMLHTELAGYPAYAEKTRFRLVPFVW